MTGSVVTDREAGKVCPFCGFPLKELRIAPVHPAAECSHQSGRKTRPPACR
jgi:hypothetical protein